MDGAVGVYRFKRVFRTRRIKTTMVKREECGNKMLIEPDQHRQRVLHIVTPGQTLFMVEERPANAWFIDSRRFFLEGRMIPPLYKKTISVRIPESTSAVYSSRFDLNASLINRFTRLRWTAFRIPLVTAKPIQSSVFCATDDSINAFNGFCSNFLPWDITLVKVPNPRRDSIVGCTGGNTASSFRQVFFFYFSLLTESFFLPAARLRFMTFRPFFVDIRARNPCVFFRFRLCGWYVLFILRSRYGVSFIF